MHTVIELQIEGSQIIIASKKLKLDITHLCICLVLNVRVYPSVPNANSLQILDIDRVALQDDLSSGRDVVPSCKGGRERGEVT